MSKLKPLLRWSLFVSSCLASALLIKPVQDRIDALPSRSRVDLDQLYFSSPGILKRMALGYESLMADVYWMRAIQYYGRRDEADRRTVRYKNLPLLLDITTTLDPEMLDVYRAGSCFLAEAAPLGAGQPQEAIKLLDKGIATMPQEWRLRFDKGFVYFWHVKDYRSAGEIWLEASRLPAAPPWMEALAARGLSQGGSVDTAKDLWRRQYEGSAREDVRNNAWNHLASIQVDEDLWTLEFLAERYAARHGAPPARLEDMLRAGLLSRIPLDPSGTPYEYDHASGKAYLSVQSKVRYLRTPYDYRAAFREKLERLYGTAEALQSDRKNR